VSTEADPVHRGVRYWPVAHRLLHAAHAMSWVEFGGRAMYWFAAHTVPLHALHAVELPAAYPPLNVPEGHGVGAAIPPAQ
jgi:hypothetical protein